MKITMSFFEIEQQLAVVNAGNDSKSVTKAAEILAVSANIPLPDFSNKMLLLEEVLSIYRTKEGCFVDDRTRTVTFEIPESKMVDVSEFLCQRMSTVGVVLKAVVLFYEGVRAVGGWNSEVKEFLLDFIQVLKK